MLFNAVPLLVVAALYLAVGVTLAPRARRASAAARVRRRWLLRPPRSSDVAILVEREPLGGHLWSRSSRSCSRRSRPSSPLRDGALVPARAARAGGGAPSSAAGADSRGGCSTRDERCGSRACSLDELAEPLRARRREPGAHRGTAAATRGSSSRATAGATTRRSSARWSISSRETSGISTVVREAAAFAVFDAEGSPIVNKRLNEIARVKSCAFVPMIAGGEVVGVVFAAVRKPRVFAEDELALMQSFAAEAGLALERVRAVGRARGGARARAADRALLARAALAARPRRAPPRRRRGDGEGGRR